MEKKGLVQRLLYGILHEKECCNEEEIDENGSCEEMDANEPCVMLFYMLIRNYPFHRLLSPCCETEAENESIITKEDVIVLRIVQSYCESEKNSEHSMMSEASLQYLLRLYKWLIEKLKDSVGDKKQIAIIRERMQMECKQIIASIWSELITNSTKDVIWDDKVRQTLISLTLQEFKTIKIEDSKEIRPKSYKCSFVRLIGNLTFRQPKAQDYIREEGGIVILLNLCSIDEQNPFLREWTILALRNICEDNIMNQVSRENNAND